MKLFQPSLPYNNTEGYAQNSESVERAEKRARSGRAAVIQQQVWDLLTQAGRDGVTYTEVMNLLGLESNQANPPLSNLHKDGRIAKLEERRNGSGIYVHIEFVDHRKTVPHGGMDQEKWERIGRANGWLELH